MIFSSVLSSFIKMHVRFLHTAPKASTDVRVSYLKVIDAAIRELHESLLAATSLDEMISLHQMHLERLLHRLFLRENVSKNVGLAVIGFINTFLLSIYEHRPLLFIEPYSQFWTLPYV